VNTYINRRKWLYQRDECLAQIGADTFIDCFLEGFSVTRHCVFNRLPNCRKRFRQSSCHLSLIVIISSVMIREEGWFSMNDSWRQ